MAEEPLLSRDLESGQGATPTGEAEARPADVKKKEKGGGKKTQKKKGANSDDILPNIMKLGLAMKDAVAQHPQRLRVQYDLATSGDKNEKWSAWVHYYSTYLPAVTRTLKILFLSEMRNIHGGGNAARGKLRDISWSLSGANLRLIKAIQVVEKLKAMATQHSTVYHLICAFQPSAQQTVLDGIGFVDNNIDELELEIMMKFVNMFCLMALYAIPPVGTFLVRHFHTVEPRCARVILADPQELLPSTGPPDNPYQPILQGLWGVDEEGLDEPAGLNFKDYIAANFSGRFKGTSAEPLTADESPADPLHPNWLAPEAGLLFVVSRYFEGLKAHDNANMTEQKLLVEFVDLLSSTQGILKAELKVVEAMQAKILSSASTGFLSLLTIVLHKLQVQSH